MHPRVDAVLAMTSPSAAETVVFGCAPSGIRRVWLHKGAGAGSLSAQAVAFCQERGIQVIPFAEQSFDKNARQHRWFDCLLFADFVVSLCFFEFLDVGRRQLGPVDG